MTGREPKQVFWDYLRGQESRDDAVGALDRLARLPPDRQIVHGMTLGWHDLPLLEGADSAWLAQLGGQVPQIAFRKLASPSSPTSRPPSRASVEV
jgi:hypothetical protein